MGPSVLNGVTMGPLAHQKVRKTLNEKRLTGESACPTLVRPGGARRFRLPTLRARTGVFNGALPRNLSERSLAVAVR
jgi:hypothetical protein